MRQPAIDHQEINEMFMSGHFVEHRITGSFNAVSPDMKHGTKHSKISKKHSWYYWPDKKKQSM